MRTLEEKKAIVSEIVYREVEKLLFDDLYTLFEKSGIDGTIDCAVPLQFQKELQAMGIDSVDYVFHYSPENRYGKPLSKYEILHKAIHKIYDSAIEKIS